MAPRFDVHLIQVNHVPQWLLVSSPTTKMKLKRTHFMNNKIFAERLQKGGGKRQQGFSSTLTCSVCVIVPSAGVALQSSR